MIRLLLAALLLTLASPAAAQQQNVLQGGSVTSGHAAYWVAPGIIADAGTPVSGTLTGLGITQGAGPGLCINSAPVSSGAYNQLCLSTTTTGGGQISLTNIGGATGALSLSGATFNFQALTLAPPADTVALAITQTGVGDNGGNLTGLLGFGFAYNTTSITDQRADYGTSSITYGSLTLVQTGGPTTRGSKIGIGSRIIRVAAEEAVVAYGDMIAGLFVAQTNVPDGGTNTSSGARGTIFGLNPGASLGVGATNYLAVSGAEVDVGIDVGASARWRFGWSIVNTGSVQGAEIDAALEIGSAGLPGQWKDAILLSNIHGLFPLATNGSVIRADSAGTITNGIDLSLTTITGNFLRGPSGNFNVDGSGNITGKTLVFAGSVQPYIEFIPSAGATKFAQIFQQANILQFADAGVAVTASLDIATGVFKPGILTVATLPAAASWQGGRALVTDSNATTTAGIGAVVAGGGANVVPVYSDGTNWRIGG